MLFEQLPGFLQVLLPFLLGAVVASIFHLSYSPKFKHGLETLGYHLGARERPIPAIALINIAMGLRGVNRDLVLDMLVTLVTRDGNVEVFNAMITDLPAKELKWALRVSTLTKLTAGGNPTGIGQGEKLFLFLKGTRPLNHLASPILDSERNLLKNCLENECIGVNIQHPN